MDMAKIFVKEEDKERITRIINSFDLDYSLERDFVDKEKIENLQIAELDKKDWIVVPKEFTNGKYLLRVSPARLSYNSAVEKVGKELGINYKNISEDSLGRKFVGNNDWKNSLMLVQFLGAKAPSLEQKINYFRLLYLGFQEKVKVYDVSGKEIDSKLCEKLLRDTVGANSPWRGEWLNNDLKTSEKGLEVRAGNTFDKEGNLIDYKSEILDKNTLMKDKTPGISLEDYLEKNHTSQGFPNKEVKSGDLYYWFPKSDNNSVVRFVANSGGAYLNCNRNPWYRYSVIGVGAIEEEK